LRGHCELEAGARLPVAGSDKTSQNQSTTPPILNQINRRNQQSVGLSEPNIRLKIHTGIPYAAGTAAQNACAAANLRRKFFFHRTNQPPSLRASEPPSPITWPQPYTKPYNRLALHQPQLKLKRWQNRTTKTHPAYPPISHPQAPELAL